jgi:hypothetical protein
MEGSTLNRDQLLTVGDLQNFKVDLLREIASLIAEKTSVPLKEWLRTSEVRQILGVSSGTLQNLRITRKVSFSKIGGIVFYKYDDVMALLQENCVPKTRFGG